MTSGAARAVDQPAPELVDHQLTVGPGPDVLAMGAWFKNTVCAVRGETAWISPTVGDLDAVDACLDHERIARALLAHCAATPRAVAHDLHPDFHSSRFAVELADELGVPAIPVQHHHAHIAAVCAEHRRHGPVIGLALDGVGLGSDGTAWGGELLMVDGHRWERRGGLRPLPLPGGDRAAREPWRVAAAVLHELGRAAEIPTRFAAQPAADRLPGLLRSGLRCPPTSSMGRVFDAAAGLLGLCRVMSVEAEAAIRLEQAAARFGPGQVLADGWSIDADHTLDLFPLLASLVDDADVPRAAARFHATVAAALADWVTRQSGLLQLGTVALGGGCLVNRILREDLATRLAAAELRLLEPQTLSPGDTAIALGQAVIARGIVEEM